MTGVSYFLLPVTFVREKEGARRLREDDSIVE
jgi:hypothetical protein